MDEAEASQITIKIPWWRLLGCDNPTQVPEKFSKVKPNALSAEFSSTGYTFPSNWETMRQSCIKAHNRQLDEKRQKGSQEMDPREREKIVTGDTRTGDPEDIDRRPDFTQPLPRKKRKVN